MTAVLREHIGGGAKATRLHDPLAAGATSLVVEAGGLASWPDGTVGRIPVVIDAGQPSEEHAYATGKSGDTLTGLVRGQDGTADQPHAANAVVHHGIFGLHVDRANELLSLPQAKGDILAAGAADDWRRLAAGAGRTVLTVQDPDDFTTETGLQWTGAWATWVPFLTASSGGTDPYLGSTGSATGQYAETGDLVTVDATLRFDGTGPNAGSGPWNLGLPISARVPSSRSIVGHGIAWDASANTGYAVVAEVTAPAFGVSSGVRFLASGVAGGVGPGVPFVWAAGDHLSLNLSYRRA